VLHVDRLLPEQQVQCDIGMVPRRSVEARRLQSSSITTPKGAINNMTFRFAALSLALVSISHPALASVDASPIDSEGLAIDALYDSLPLDSSGVGSADTPLSSVDAPASLSDATIDLSLPSPDARSSSSEAGGGDTSSSVDASVGRDALAAVDGGARGVDGSALDAGPKPILLADGGAQRLVTDDRGCSIGALGSRRDQGLGFGALPFLAWAAIRVVRRRGRS
jgi:hypothetical protein